MKSLILSLLLVPLFAQAEVSPSRALEIQKVASATTPFIVGNVAQYRENPKLPGPAWSLQATNGGYVIEFNNAILNNFSASARKFVIYHEVGHILLGHLKWPRETPEQKSIVEFEADLFAAYYYKQNEIIDDGLMDFLGVMRTQTKTTPPGPARLQAILAVLIPEP